MSNELKIKAVLGLLDEFVFRVVKGDAASRKIVRAEIEAAIRKLAAPERTEQAAPLESHGLTTSNVVAQKAANLSDKPQQAAPGFVMVPVQRLANARNLVDRGHWDTAAKILDELLAARPAPASPTAQPSVEPVGEREAFEAWAESAGFNINRDNTEKYIDYHKVTTRHAWSAWQARASKGTP